MCPQGEEQLLSRVPVTVRTKGRRKDSNAIGSQLVAFGSRILPCLRHSYIDPLIPTELLVIREEAPRNWKEP